MYDLSVRVFQDLHCRCGSCGRRADGFFNTVSEVRLDFASEGRGHRVKCDLTKVLEIIEHVFCNVRKSIPNDTFKALVRMMDRNVAVRLAKPHFKLLDLLKKIRRVSWQLVELHDGVDEVIHRDGGGVRVVTGDEVVEGLFISMI